MRKFNRYPQPPHEYQPAPNRAAAAARFDRLISGSSAVQSVRACVDAGKATFGALPVVLRFQWRELDTCGHPEEEVARGKARAEREFQRVFMSSARDGFLSVPSWQRAPLPEGTELLCTRAFGSQSWREESLDEWQDWRAAQNEGYNAGRQLALGLPQ